MSLTSIFNSANSGLMVAQAQLRVVSDNVANVNTPGYVRKVVDQRSTSIEGLGTGVEVASVRLVTDRFLQAASLTASADAARAGARSELLDKVQNLFGDPTGAGGFFGMADRMFAALATTSEDPLSSPRRQEAIIQAKALLDEAARVSAGIQAARLDAESGISAAMDSINTLLDGIEKLNVEISRAFVGGGDTSGAESAQAQMIDQLAQYMDVRILPRANGGVTLRTGDGMLLAGNGAARVEYTQAGTVDARSDFPELWLTEPHGQKRALLDHLRSGELKGLVEFRDVEGPQIAERLAEVTSRIVAELNRAHNANSAAPAPNALIGRNTGLDLPTAVSGFTGRTTVAVTDSAGVIQRRVAIDFDAGTMSVDGGGPTAFTPGGFLGSLNTALGAFGTASFSGGVLSLAASGGNGVAVGDDAAAPSMKAGRGFSAFFGLNDLIRSDRIADYDTGLRSTDPHGFGAGDTVTFRFTSPAGSKLRDIAVAMPAGASMADMLTALNDSATGVGRYGSFALDGNGRLAFTPSGEANMSIVDDDTSRGAGGPSFSELFGVDAGTRGARASGFTIRSDIDRDPRYLALAKLDLTAAAGQSALSTGDGRGAQALADAGQIPVDFDPAGNSAGGAMSISRYLSDLSGDIGGRAAAAEQRRGAAEALANEANSRRTSYEGVNLDEELVKLTTFQQAFNASARMIQAAKDMYDTLIGMT